MGLRWGLKLVGEEVEEELLAWSTRNDVILRSRPTNGACLPDKASLTSLELNKFITTVIRA
jgi:hypothetical protein